MYTSLFVLALVGAPLEANAPSWQSYSQASQAAEQEKKPLAVFLGTGQKGWEMVAGSLSPEAEKVLAAGYLCAYVDTTTPEGEKLAQAFDIKSGVGLVLEVIAPWPEASLLAPRHLASKRSSSTACALFAYLAHQHVLRCHYDCHGNHPQR